MLPQICSGEQPQTDKKAGSQIHLELYGDSQKTLGARLQNSMVEVRTAGRPESGKINFGILFSTEKLCKELPLQVKYGNLSFSGSLSKLNSPELSNGSSPFTSSILSASCLSANLPGYSSFSKSESSFLQIKLHHLKKRPLSLTVNLALQPETSTSVFSTIISDKFFSNQLTINASCTAGHFLYKAKDSSSWILDSPYYASDTLFCSLFQLSAIWKNKGGSSLQSAIMTALYESPFGPYTQVWRGDIKFSLKQTEFYLSSFLNSYENLLTSSEKQIDPCAQFKAGLITKKPLLSKNKNLFFIKSGINACTKINLTQTEHPLRLNTGIQFSSDITSLSFSVSIDSKMKSSSPEEPPQTIEKDKIAFKLSNSWNLKKLSPGMTIAIEENKYKFSINLANNSAASRHRFNGNCSLSLSTRDGQIEEKKFTAGLTCRLNFKYLTIVGKLSTTLE